MEQVEQKKKLSGGNTKTPSNLNFKARNYCITINNPMEQDILKFKNFNNCKYIYQLEQGNEEKTKHLQGYLMFKNPTYFNSIKKQLPRAHIEKARGTKKQNIQYCTKQDTRIDGPFSNFEWKEFGEKYKGPTKEELKEIAKDIASIIDDEDYHELKLCGVHCDKCYPGNFNF